MAITVSTGHIARAIDFFSKSSIYFALGRSETPWDDDANPPDPDVNDVITEVYGYKRAEAKYLVIPDEEGTISYRGTKWKIVSESEAIEKGSRWVYLSSYLDYEELPLKPFRQIGIVSNLTPTDSISSDKLNLLPSEVKSTGVLEVLDNRKPVYRQQDQREHLSIIIEF